MHQVFEISFAEMLVIQTSNYYTSMDRGIFMSQCGGFQWPFILRIPERNRDLRATMVVNFFFIIEVKMFLRMVVEQ